MKQKRCRPPRAPNRFEIVQKAFSVAFMAALSSPSGTSTIDSRHFRLCAPSHVSAAGIVFPYFATALYQWCFASENLGAYLASNLVPWERNISPEISECLVAFAAAPNPILTDTHFGVK
jgi:hypothetical protein